MPQRAPGLRLSAGDWWRLVVLSVLWGGSFFFMGVAVTGLPPFTIVLCRIGLAALVLNAVVLLSGQRLPTDPARWRIFLIMGFFNNLLPFSLIVWGQTQIPSGLAAILNATTPLFTALVAQIATSDERLTPPKIAGLLLGFAGVAVLIGPNAWGGFGADLWAQAAVLGAALSYGVSSVIGRRFGRLGVSPLQSSAGQLSAATLFILPLALAIDHPWALPMPGVPVLAAVTGLAVVSTALAYILFFQILASAGATNVSLVTLLVPVSALLLGALVLGERLSWNAYAGLALICAALLIVDGRLLKRR